MIAAGDLNRKVTFRRRKVMPNAPRHLREGWEAIGLAWASWKEERAREITVGSFRLWARGGILTLREDSFSKALTCSEQVVVDGEVFNLIGRVLQPAPDGSIKFQAQSAPSPALYEQEMNRGGELVTVRRIVPNANPVECEARALVSGYTADELAGGVKQGMRSVLLLAADLAGGSFPLPLRMDSVDRIVTRDRSLVVMSVDDNTHRFAGELNAYEIKAKG